MSESTKPKIVIAIESSNITVFSTVDANILAVNWGVGQVGDRGVFRLNNQDVNVKVTKLNCEPNMDQLAGTRHEHAVNHFTKLHGWEASRFLVLMYDKSQRETARVVAARNRGEARVRALEMWPGDRIIGCYEPGYLEHIAVQAEKQQVANLLAAQEEAIKRAKTEPASPTMQKFLRWLMAAPHVDWGRMTLNAAQKRLTEMSERKLELMPGLELSHVREELLAEMRHLIACHGRYSVISLWLPMKEEKAD
jgi:hypothetical protein